MTAAKNYAIPCLVGIILALAVVALKRRTFMPMKLETVPAVHEPTPATESGPGSTARSGPRVPASTVAASNSPWSPPQVKDATPRPQLHGKMREVTIQGLIQVEVPEPEHELPPGISPFGLAQMAGTEEAALRSVMVSTPTGESAFADEGGAFQLRVRLPEDQVEVALAFQSPFLVYGEHRGDAFPVRLPPGSTTVEVEVFMRPGMSFQPTFNGKPITPEDLSNPEVQKAFFEQSSQFIDQYFAFDGSLPPGTSEPLDLVAPRQEFRSPE